MEQADLTRRFAYHPPQDDITRDAHATVRLHCLELARSINLLVADGREKSLAITALEECMMWTNAGIARQGSDRGRIGE